MGAERGAEGGAVREEGRGADVIEARVDGAGLAMWLRTVDRICRGRVGEGTWTFEGGGLTVEWSGIHNSFPGALSGALPGDGGGQGVAVVEPDQMRALAQDCPRQPGLLVQAGAARIRLGAVEAEAQVEIGAAAERALFALEERPPEPAPEPAPVPQAEPRRTRKRAALEALSLLPGRSGSAGGGGAGIGQEAAQGGEQRPAVAGELGSVAGEDLGSAAVDDLRSDVADVQGPVAGDDLRSAPGGDQRSVEADAQGPAQPEARPVEVPPTALLPLFSALPGAGEGEPRGTVIELQPWALPENALMARGAPLAEVLGLRWRYDGATLGRAGVARAVAAAHRQKEHLIGQAAALLEPLGVPPELLERWVEAHLEARATGRESFSIGNVVYIDKKSRQVKLFGN